MSMKNNHPASDADELNSSSNPLTPRKKRKGTPKRSKHVPKRLTPSKIASKATKRPDQPGSSEPACESKPNASLCNSDKDVIEENPSLVTGQEKGGGAVIQNKVAQVEPMRTDAPQKPPVLAITCHSRPSRSASSTRQMPLASHGRPKWKPDIIDWCFRLMNAALVCLALYFGWATWVQLPDLMNDPILRSQTVAAGVEKRDDRGPTPGPRLDDYRVVLKRDLFAASSQHKKPQTAQDELLEVPLAGSEHGLKLSGTIVTQDQRLNYAIIDKMGTAEQGIFRTRDRVGKATVLAIFRNQVIIETETGTRLRLSVDKEPGTATAAQPMLAAAIMPAAFSLSPPSQSDDGVFQISAADVISSFSDPEKVIEETIITPYTNEGRPDGFFLGRLRAADVLYRIGLRTGDAIRGVDGIEFAGPEDAERLLSHLTEGGRITLMVNRRGIEQNIEVLIN
jgi:type II secretion system protein C